MARSLLFNEAYFYENSPVDENVNYKVIRPVIWDCQELYIQDILGSPLYRALKDEIETNAGSLTTPLYITLVNDYVAPCLLNYSLMEAQVTMLYKFRNQSVLTERSEFGDPVDYQTHKYLVDKFRDKAEQYAEKIERYLRYNQASYPLYTTYTTSEEVRAQHQKPTVSVHLGSYTRPYPYGSDYWKNL